MFILCRSRRSRVNLGGIYACRSGAPHRIVLLPQYRPLSYSDVMNKGAILRYLFDVWGSLTRGAKGEEGNERLR